MMESICGYDANYKFVHGDERYFSMLGDYVECDLDKLVHKDDWEGFKEFLNSENYEDPYMVRMLIKQDCYRYVLIYQSRDLDRHILYNIEAIKYFLTVHDVVQVTHKFSDYFNNMRKYRRFLSQINVNYFDYDMSTEMFSVYYYAGGHSKVIFKEKLSDWKQQIIDEKRVLPEDLSEFEKLCTMIGECKEEFNVTLHTSMFSKDPNGFEAMCFKGELYSDGFKLNMVIGIVYSADGAFASGGNKEDADLDMFTGLLNKKVATETIINEINEAAKTNFASDMYLCVIDIDDFKSVNDTYGHRFGDEVILALANALKETFENNGILGRIGGDEFMCLLSDFNSLTEFKTRLTEMRKKLKEDLAVRMPGYTFAVSIGVATYPEYGKTYDELFRIADASLYIAKEKGKDRYIIYNKEIHAGYLTNRESRSKVKVMADFMKPIEKSQMAASMIIRIMQGGKDTIGEVLDELMDRMNVHGIVIAMCDRKEPDIVIGHYAKKMEKVSFTHNKRYMSSFDENGMNIVNNINSLSYYYNDIYTTMKEFDLCSTLQIKLMKGRKCVAVACFDTFGEHRRKWSQEDISTVYMVCQAIESVI
jgi:diguanylate cyclase (GGDEF)-like protein